MAGPGTNRAKELNPDACANCGRPIGKLETPHIYNDNIVCAECAARLGVQSLKHIPRAEDEVAIAPDVQILRPRSGKGKVLLILAILLGGLGAAAIVAVPRLDLHEDNAFLFYTAGWAFAALGGFLFLLAMVSAIRNRR